jgi:Tat protein secretion system quality control protein TatD with DNase activity
MREFILKNTANCHGFYGASSMERLPTEVALTETDAPLQAPSAAVTVDGKRPAAHRTVTT